MIFVDTNYFLRALLDEQPGENPDHFIEAQKVFRAAEQGIVKLITSDAILAKMFCVLSGTVYRLNRSEIARMLRRLIASRDLAAEQ